MTQEDWRSELYLYKTGKHFRLWVSLEDNERTLCFDVV